MEHTITRTIPEGEFCDENFEEPCPFLCGELHNLCFVCGDDLDEERDQIEGKGGHHNRVIKHEKCPARGNDGVPVLESGDV
ncbi:hypothetical protein LCGC14_0994560 [marine sediment metagenome]|uniref:Uncharacterized protein n=1 Tax=marine sediment metagenome TaxID=412755 RepID=A0A0F9N4U3_9ZZZZ